jgi:hypothetical protein
MASRCDCQATDQQRHSPLMPHRSVRGTRGRFAARSSQGLCLSRLGRPSDLLAELPPLAVAATRRLKLTECGIGDRGPTLLSSLRLTAMPNRKHGSLGTPSLARLVDHRRLTGISGPVAVVRLRPGPALTMSTKCKPMSRLRSARESRAIDGGGTRAGRARCRESADKRKGGPTLWCAGRERHCGRRRGR